jgi:GH15 family glucan-1,4-alpha-glucosidase
MVTLRHQCLKGDVAAFRGEGLTTTSEFTLREGDEVCFAMTYSYSVDAETPPKVDVEKELADTEAYWCEWTAKSQYKGEYTEAVARSLMTLEAMTYKPTGGIVAAVTAGLPERIGGERNWDYRYCWLRDTSFTLLILIRAGYTEEAIRWRMWLLRAVAGAPEQIQALYGIGGERQLVEWNATWLRGYEESRPVRIGNAAAEQFQLDVFGEVAVALHRIPDAEDDIRIPAMALQASLIDHLCKVWDQPDEGIWETRGGRKDFTYGRFQCWIAFDRAIRMAAHRGRPADLARWTKARDDVYQQIMTKGWNSKIGAFTQHYTTEVLDSSMLLMPLQGFIAPDDPMWLSTLKAMDKELVSDSLVYRYNPSASPDGLAGDEGTFSLCTFWYVDALARAGRLDDARLVFEKMHTYANHLGLFSEEISSTGEQLGNFPQAFSHLSLISAAINLDYQLDHDANAPSPVVAAR